MRIKNSGFPLFFKSFLLPNRLVLSKINFSLNSIIIRFTFFLVTCTYLLFLYATYGNEISKVFLQVDQARMISLVQSLEKHWTLFPASLENITDIGYPTHFLDVQIKWFFTLFMSTTSSFFLVNILIYFLWGYSLYRLKLPHQYSILLFLFALSALKLPSPNEILQMIRLPFDFTLKSDIFNNTSTNLGFLFLTFTWKCPFPIRLIIYTISFYIKSPAIPALFIVELYLIFLSDRSKQTRSTINKPIKILLVLFSFILSYYFFFYSSSSDAITLDFIATSNSLISVKIRHNINWLSNGALLFDLIFLLLTIRLNKKFNQKLLVVFFYFLALSLLLYDSLGLIQINIAEFRQVEVHMKYALLMIILHLNAKVQLGEETHEGKLLSKITFAVLIFNCYFFSHFLGTLIVERYHRFSEYVDNSQLIDIVSPIANENDVVAYNTVDSPIRKGKQLQLCGIIKNPLWASNLGYGISKNRLNASINWKILQHALLGEKNFPEQIKWLIINKSKKNYKLDNICPKFILIKENHIYILLQKKTK